VKKKEVPSEVPSSEQARFMRRALELARNGLGLAAPNPMVGAVVVNGGRVVG
jgi:diaminohydroxyphosphoribosylaminopyrimidine deaminase/5-amino-6-(5-phosphoribosylamino)uracil reductase